ncbi:MAG: hypothetical protein NC416_04815 [Eubacterium sp.]|nr:hypothetical protein [Eubacterium sp.]
MRKCGADRCEQKIKRNRIVEAPGKVEQSGNETICEVYNVQEKGEQDAGNGV